MSGSYKQIDHTADIAFEVSGNSLEELFKASSKAWLTSVIDVTTFSQSENKKIKLSSYSKEQLLVDFLSELNFYLFTKKWLCYSVDDLSIVRKMDDWSLSASLTGNNINFKINLKQEIKAITFHQMNIKKSGNVFSTLLVFDI
ncbi:MAG: archease [Ignavibacteriaceae bacterium]|jgi:SHS2 domain-containing protein